MSTVIQFDQEVIMPTSEPREKWTIIPIDGLTDLKQIDKAHRLNALGSLYYFLHVILRRHKTVPHLHLEMCLYVEADHLKEMIEIPRDHYKSTIYSEASPMWWALPFTEEDEFYMRALGYSDRFMKWMKRAHNVNTRTLLVSETIDNAIKLGMKIDNHYKQNDFFRKLFPEIMPDSSCTWTNKSMTHKRNGGNHGEGTYDFLGVGGALQSRHYDRVIQDDLVGRDALKSEIVMNDTIEYHKLLVGAFDADEATQGQDNDEIVVGNRWSYRDLNSHIRVNERQFSPRTHSATGGCCSKHPFGRPIFPELFSLAKLEQWQQRLGTYLYSCFGVGTKILMSDWTEKNIEDVKPGDKVVGYHFVNGRWKLTESLVEGASVREVPIIAHVETSDGRTFNCTPDHKFWRRRNPKGLENTLHKPYNIIREGSPIFSVYSRVRSLTLEEEKLLFWLGGLFDGEGTCQSYISISQSRTKNSEICAYLESTLDKLKIPWRYEESSNSYYLQGGRSLKFKLLNYCGVAKKQRIVFSLWNEGGKVCSSVNEKSQHWVTKWTYEAQKTLVYNIQTSTGNYVAEGYATKNCQFLNNPLPPGTQFFRESDLRFYEFDVSDTFIDDAGKRAARVKIVHEVKNGEAIPDVQPGLLQRSIIVDPNHSGVDGRCRHAITVTGRSEKPERIYLLDCWAEASTYDTLVNKIYELCVKWKMREFWLETVAAQKYLKHHIEYVFKLKNIPVKVRELKTDRTANGKDTRIQTLQPIFETGRFWIRKTGQENFIQEFSKYSPEANNTTVDILDTLGYAPQTWHGFVSQDELLKFISQHRTATLNSLSQAGY